MKSSRDHYNHVETSTIVIPMYPGSPQFEFLGSLTAKSQRRYLRGGNVLPYIVWGRRTRDVGHMKRYCINDYSLVWSLINFVFPNTGL